MRIPVLIQTDFYKTGHHKMYPKGTTKIYSNLTPRKSRIPGIERVVVFGVQYFIKEYLIDQWKDFFLNHSNIEKYKRMMDYCLGKDVVTTEHLEDLYKLGYLPLHIKALPEGSLCPIRVPLLTIINTHPSAYWLVNYLETIMSAILWKPITSATLAREYKKGMTKDALETVGATDFVKFQGHDFSMRGMSGLEDAILSGAGHLTSFVGTDTIPAIWFMEEYYNANIEEELVGTSVPATEHSVMCMGMKEGEIQTFADLLNKYPTGILSVVSDTWDLWKVCTEILPELKEKIMARDGKLVIRPDSGDPCDIICGMNTSQKIAKNIAKTIHPSWKGVIELLWDVFGGKVNDKGYKELDPHIGAIYDDSITIERRQEMADRLKAKGFASTNIVFGIGSYTYEYQTRDTFGMAIKATYGEVTRWGLFYNGKHLDKVECREIFKDPITDDGTKKSAKGLIKVQELFKDGKHHSYILLDQQTWEQENQGALQTVFLYGELKNETSLNAIRALIDANLSL